MTREEISLQELDFAKSNGLVSVVIQDAATKEVLMLAYTNMEALKKTLETGYAHYWSRSRQKLWMKGETSGNVQRVKQILVDCDRDALLFIVDQIGNACHTGKKTCFHNRLSEWQLRLQQNL